MSLFQSKKEQLKVAAGAAEKAIGQIDELREEYRLMEKRVHKLTVVCKALLSYVKEIKGITDDDFLKKMEEVEKVLENDGQGLDGPARSCMKCGRPVNKKDNKCLYCGFQHDPSGGW